MIRIFGIGLLVLCLTASSCSSKQLNKKLAIDISCTKCKTPYGSGESVNLKVYREIGIVTDKK